MSVPLLDLTRQYSEIRDRLDSTIVEAARSGQYIMGPYVKAFEEKVAAYIGVKHAIGVASGTDALLLVLDAIGIKPGDEVITTPFSFFATSEVISRLGAKPVFVDVLPDSMNMNPKLLEKAITPKTKAILPVHIFGLATDMNPLMDIAKKHNLFVLEDVCQAIGSEYRGKKLGSVGDAGAYSFFPSKNLGAFGDGGLITTNNDELADKVRMLKQHGSAKRYINEILGYNSRLDGLQSAILAVKLDYLDKWNDARRANAAAYNEAFTANKNIIPQKETEGSRHTYHQYTIRITNGKRDAVAKALGEKGIGHAIYYPIPLHLQKAHADLGHKKGDFPVCDMLSDEVISLPIFPELTVDERNEVIRAVLEAV